MLDLAILRKLRFVGKLTDSRKDWLAGGQLGLRCAALQDHALFPSAPGSRKTCAGIIPTRLEPQILKTGEIEMADDDTLGAAACQH